MTDDEPLPDADAIPLDDQAASGVLDRTGFGPEPEPEPLPVLETREPEVEPRRDVLEAVQAIGEKIERRLSDLQGIFEREVRAEATREKMIDRLHAELQESKQDLLLNTLRPVFIDLIQLHDDIGKVAVCPESADETVRRLVSLMHGFQQGVEDILYRQGVEPFEIEGDIFDARRQRAISTVPTDDPARNKTIAARLRKGFQAREKVIRPEVVSVYAHKK